MLKYFNAAAAAVVAALLLAGAVYGQGPIGMSYPERVRMLEQALSHDPGNANTLIQLGNTYYDWGFKEVNSKGQNAQPGYYWEKAIDYYGRALEKNPEDANVRTDRANLLWYTGNIDEAIKEYRKVKEYDPKHVQSRLNLVNILGQEKGDYKAAIKEYDELVKVSPSMSYDMQLKETIDKYRSIVEGGGEKAAPAAPTFGGQPQPQQPQQQQQQPAPEKKDDPYEFKW